MARRRIGAMAEPPDTSMTMAGAIEAVTTTTPKTTTIPAAEELPVPLLPTVTLPLPSRSTLKAKDRYEPIVHQITRLIMRHGKLAAAQRVRVHTIVGTHVPPRSVPSVAVRRR